MTLYPVVRAVSSKQVAGSLWQKRFAESFQQLACRKRAGKERHCGWLAGCLYTSCVNWFTLTYGLRAMRWFHLQAICMKELHGSVACENYSVQEISYCIMRRFLTLLTKYGRWFVLIASSKLTFPEQHFVQMRTTCSVDIFVLDFSHTVPGEAQHRTVFIV